MVSSSSSNHSKYDEESSIGSPQIDETLVLDQINDLKVADNENGVAITDITNYTNFEECIKTDEVISLIDISHNKQWICYISHPLNQPDDYSITRNPFIGQEHSTIKTNIKEYIERTRNFCCQFLSISPTGEYVALSFYETSGTNSFIQNPNCLIFKLESGDFKLHMKIRLKGRAVFFNTSEDDFCCLALVSIKTVRIYNKFCDTTKLSDYYFYELPEFSSTTSTIERLSDQKSFADETATWSNVVDSALQDRWDELYIIITTSRHIRDNVIVTPFKKRYIGGATRVWSMADDGVRLTSFFAPGEHIIAFSKDLKYAATFMDEVRAVKIYNMKSGLLVYTLKSCCTSNEISTYFFDVSHARFCYDSRYLALSLVLKTADYEGKVVSTEIVFEVWYIEAEKSIFTKTEKTGVNCAEDSQRKCANCILNEEEGENRRACFLDSKSNKTVRPFVTKGLSDDGERRCLRGVFTYFNQGGESKIKSVELDIDGSSSIENDSELQDNNAVDYSSTIRIDSKIAATANQGIRLEWNTEILNNNENSNEHAEISNELNELSNSEDLNCGYITIGGEKKYLIRFGRHTIQLWRWSDSYSVDKGDLVYIRAYKRPDYGLAYSFNDIWQIADMNSIKFIEGGTPAGRLIVNIKKDDIKELEGIYHTEEIFLPIESDTANTNEEFDYHKLESACQALHFLYTFIRGRGYRFEVNEKETQKEEFEEELRFKKELKRMSFIEQEMSKYAWYKKVKLKKNSMKLFKKTREIIDKAIKSIHQQHSPNFFSTIAGSRALAMLASFSEGRQIIIMILKNKTIPISIFSYPMCINDIEETESNAAKLYQSVPAIKDPNRKLTNHNYRNSRKPDEVLIGHIQSIAENENVLTVLIRELDYDLYNLMFNRILHDSKRNGPGCLSALVDALIYLQEEGNYDLLLKSSQKLSYLEIERSVLGILDSEIDEKFQKVFISNIRNLECRSTMEQMSKYSLSNMSQLKYRLKNWIYNKYHVKNVGALLHLLIWENVFVYLYKKIFKESKKEVEKRTKLCVVPLPYFNTYDRLPEDRYRNKLLKTSNGGVWEQGNLYKRKSAFITVASYQGENNFFKQGDSVLEVMLQYKWQTFIRARFVGVCLIHVLYYVTYCTGVLFAKEMYDYDAGNNITDSRHIASLSILLASGLVFFAQELHQIIKSQRTMEYFRSGYNYVDILALVFPLVTFLQMRLGGDYFYEISCVGTLIIWLHGILRLRVLLFFGIAIETIIQLARRVASILLVLVIIVFAFTHAFIVLLRRQPDEFFQENYNGTTSIPNGGDGTTNMLDISASNGFTDPFKAFYQVWLIIFGVWDSIINGNAGDNRMLFVLCILFALITVLIFTNIVIALMSSTVDEVRNLGKRVWVNHFASVIAEMEQLWCFWPSSVQHSRENNPCYIYYIASYDVVKKHEEGLEEETEKLSKKVFGRLGDDDNVDKTCSCNQR